MNKAVVVAILGVMLLLSGTPATAGEGGTAPTDWIRTSDPGCVVNHEYREEVTVLRWAPLGPRKCGPVRFTYRMEWPVTPVSLGQLLSFLNWQFEPCEGAVLTPFPHRLRLRLYPRCIISWKEGGV